MDIGSIIKERRTTLKVTQQTLADLTGVGINTIVAIERGKGNPSLKTLTILLNALGLELTTKLHAVDIA